MKLSVCLLTRNEESNMARVLGSVAGLAEEVVVGDVGSEDGTVAAATAGGARIVAVSWEDDFAAARNAILEQATGDWILWLNPDEELLPEGRGVLRECLAREDVLAYHLRVQELSRPPRTLADRPESFAETVQVRLFRRRSDIRFTGRLHPSLKRLKEEGGRMNSDLSSSFLLQPSSFSNVVVRHHAYLSELTEPKLRWALRLLERELSDRPGELHYLIECGRTLLRLNDPRGHDVLAEATEKVLAVREAVTPPTPTVGVLLEYLLTVAPEQSRSRLSTAEAAELALRWFPSSPPMLWRVAELLFRGGNPGRAADLLERLVRCGQTGVYDRSAAFESDIIGCLAVLNLGLCRLRQGNLAEAERCFRQVQRARGCEAQAAQGLAEINDHFGRISGQWSVVSGQ